ncbi:MAG: glycoside hydrolase family 2 protein, partial [Bacteroidales bacterium]|nr:glycoside hydrolase family 2 protein [Bacteroidales bacterium]
MYKFIQNKVCCFYLLLGLLFIVSCSDQTAKIQHIKLSDNWQFRLISNTIIPEMSNEFYEAFVPGCVHTDLYRNQIIGDPFYRNNEEKLQWIENMDWEYLTLFDVNDNLLERNNIELEFKGLDTYADIYLNDEKILAADNMFRTWKVDCKKFLKKGENELRIIFYSPIKIEKAKRDSLGFDLPDIRGFTRKAPYHYGWDWGPRFVTAGIWRPVVLSAWDNVKINDIRVLQENIKKDTAIVFIEVEIQSDDTLVSEIKLSLLNGNIQVDRDNESFSLIPGLNNITLNIIIPDPKLWWPNGMGEAFLYGLHFSLLVENTIVDERALRFGLRTINLI